MTVYIGLVEYIVQLLTELLQNEYSKHDEST